MLANYSMDEVTLRHTNTHAHQGKDHYCRNVKCLHGQPQAGNDNTETGSTASPGVSRGEVPQGGYTV